MRQEEKMKSVFLDLQEGDSSLSESLSLSHLLHQAVPFWPQYIEVPSTDSWNTGKTGVNV